VALYLNALAVRLLNRVDPALAECCGRGGDRGEVVAEFVLFASTDEHHPEPLNLYSSQVRHKHVSRLMRRRFHGASFLKDE